MQGINKLILYCMAFQEPVCWIIDKKAKSILDIGCGQGLPMQLIKIRMRPKETVGVDIFKPYIEEAESKKIHDRYLIVDIRKKLPFKEKSFDVVIALQVLEHLDKKDAIDLLNKMEKIAKRQVIVATPIGHMKHPEVDNNPYQVHKSEFYPQDFQKRGYKILKFGRKSILGENGIVHKIHNPLLRRFIYGFNFILTPLFYFIQPLSDYHMYAYKNFSNKVKK